LDWTAIAEFLFVFRYYQGRYGLCRFLRDGYKTPKEVKIVNCILVFLIRYVV